MRVAAQLPGYQEAGAVSERLVRYPVHRDPQRGTLILAHRSALMLPVAHHYRDGSLQLWAQADLSEPVNPRPVAVVLTGDPVPAGHRWLATAVDVPRDGRGPEVLHVYLPEPVLPWAGGLRLIERDAGTALDVDTLGPTS